MTATTLVRGSLAAIARDQHTSIAESFVSADTIILVDTSSSMSLSANGDDSSFMTSRSSGPSRYDRACQELAALQATLPGKLAIVGFAGSPLFCPSGVPQPPAGMTDLTAALKFVKLADGLVRFIVISDGEPNNETTALHVARQFTSRIDTVFVGPETGPGADFLRRLAAASGGQSATSAQVSGLAGQLERLLTAGV